MVDYRIKPGSLRVDIPYLTVRCSAEVASIPTSPIGDLPVTNTINWGAFIHRHYYIKKPDGTIARAGNTIESNGGADVLPLSGVRNGDPGIEGREQRLLIEVGDDVIVHDQRVPVVASGQISGTEILKRWTAAFDPAEPQTKYPPPVPNFGVDRAVVVDSVTGVARVTFTASPKYWSGSGSHLWNLPSSGATLVAGYALTDMTIEVDFDPGQYDMILIATDTGWGLVDDPLLRGFRNVYVKGPGFSPFSDVVAITNITNDRTDLLGRSLTLTIRCDADTDLSDYFYTGASVLMTYQVQVMVAGVWTDLTDSVTSFRGFLAAFPLIERDNMGIATYELAIESPLIFFRRLGITSQLLQASAAPQTWLEVYTTLAHLAFVVFYIFEWNAPSLAQYIDIDFGIFETYLFPEFSFGANNLTSTAMSAVGRRPYGNVGCLSDGTIVLRDSFNILSSADRDALGLKHTWTDGEIKGKIRYERNPVPRYNRLFAACFIIDGQTTYEFQANLLAPGYGAEEGHQPDFLALDYAEGSRITGDMLARESRPTESFSYDVVGMNDVTDPAEMIPHKMDVGSYDPRDCGIWKNRFLPTVVERSWTFEREEGDFKIIEPRFSITVTGEPETKGVDAPEYTDPALGDPVAQSWCQTWDFTQEKGDWTDVVSGDVNWVAGTGWKWTATSADDGLGRRRINIAIDFPASGTITEVEYEYSLTKGSINDASNTCRHISKNTDASAAKLQNATFTATSDTAGATNSYTGSQALNYIRLWLACNRSGNATPPANGDCTMTRATLRGTGPDPFAGSRGSNCI